VVQFFRDQCFEDHRWSLKNWTTLRGWWLKKTLLYSLTRKASNRIYFLNIHINTVLSLPQSLPPYCLPHLSYMSKSVYNNLVDIMPTTTLGDPYVSLSPLIHNILQYLLHNVNTNMLWITKFQKKES